MTLVVGTGMIVSTENATPLKSIEGKLRFREVQTHTHIHTHTHTPCVCVCVYVFVSRGTD